MRSVKKDLDVFKKFEFERQPVGIKYLYLKPKGIRRLDKNMTWCEMLPEAQTAEPFYVDIENLTCAETIIMGGQHATALRAGGLSFHGGYDPRAGIRFKNQSIPRMPAGIVKYVVFAPLNKLKFDPDVLIINCDVNQAEVLLRASSYKSGKVWTSRISLYLQCAWLMVYPYLNGELNYTTVGLSYGMRFRQVLPPESMLVSIPFDLLPSVVDNLQEMEWNLKAYTLSKDEYLKWYDQQIEAAMGQAETEIGF
ncbi:MAG: DUF169 domain-containing protein [Chloroflexi bacterium]|jgi:uncharacterized protein (DUF169 family)|nr:DUF169 domain-containing protein [Chloroflexota bacterium]MBT7082522.1 DUF169 domain-containing protein [Chloroflexota bacterium]